MLATGSGSRGEFGEGKTQIGDRLKDPLGTGGGAVVWVGTRGPRRSSELLLVIGGCAKQDFRDGDQVVRGRVRFERLDRPRHAIDDFVEEVQRVPGRSVSFPAVLRQERHEGLDHQRDVDERFSQGPDLVADRLPNV